MIGCSTVCDRDLSGTGLIAESDEDFARTDAYGSVNIIINFQNIVIAFCGIICIIKMIGCDRKSARLTYRHRLTGNRKIEGIFVWKRISVDKGGEQKRAKDQQSGKCHYPFLPNGFVGFD